MSQDPSRSAPAQPGAVAPQLSAASLLTAASANPLLSLAILAGLGFLVLRSL
jgi:hypothetical protein